MSFCVFIHRSDSKYDDDPTSQYQFPRQYLERAKQCIGDWIVYLEPRRIAASRGYFAIARVQEIIPDPTLRDMYLAIIEPGTYLEFANPVPFSDAKGPIERGLLNDGGKLSGRSQSAVRPISPTDFTQITELGLRDSDTILPRIGEVKSIAGLAEDQPPHSFEDVHKRVEYLTSRAVRDRAFRSVVLRAYDSRCAMTGLRLINGRGRAEVDAAHIRPVEKHGPDIVMNGIALSGTAHWMFDRGLISLDDDRKILISRQINDPPSVLGVINKTGYATPPTNNRDYPHPRFLRWHRENCFKQ